MKLRILYILLLCAIFIKVKAQHIERNVISVAGGSAIINGVFFDWTIGEPVIETIHNEKVIISEGFHQPTGAVPFLYRIDGNILAEGLPYSDAEVFLYIADADTDTSIAALLKTNVTAGSFSFSFIPEDNYLLYAVPEVSDTYYPTYYVKTIYRNKAYVLKTDANLGGIDLQLVSKYSSFEELEQRNDFVYSVFPNPFNDNLSVLITTENQRTSRVKINDLTGKTLLFQEISPNDIFTLNLLNLPEGLYIVNIENELGSFNKLISKVRFSKSSR